jgi:hypothetical protein
MVSSGAIACGFEPGRAVQFHGAVELHLQIFEIGEVRVDEVVDDPSILLLYFEIEQHVWLEFVFVAP